MKGNGIIWAALLHSRFRRIELVFPVPVTPLGPGGDDELGIESEEPRLKRRVPRVAGSDVEAEQASTHLNVLHTAIVFVATPFPFR